MQRPQCTRQATYTRRQYKNQQLGPSHVVPTGRRALLILTNRFNHGAKRRIENARDKPQREGHEHQDHVVLVERVQEVNADARQVNSFHLDAAQTVLTAGPPVGLVKNVVHDLRQGQRHHRKINSPRPDGKVADDQPGQARCDHPHGNGSPPGPARMHHRDARQIGSDTQKGRMAKRQHAGIAKQQIEAHGIQAKDQDIDGQGVVRHQERKDQQKQQCRGNAVPSCKENGSDD